MHNEQTLQAAIEKHGLHAVTTAVTNVSLFGIEKAMEVMQALGFATETMALQEIYDIQPHSQAKRAQRHQGGADGHTDHSLAPEPAHSETHTL